jgi:hypothetical protein
MGVIVTCGQAIRSRSPRSFDLSCDMTCDMTCSHDLLIMICPP